MTLGNDFVGVSDTAWQTFNVEYPHNIIVILDISEVLVSLASSLSSSSIMALMSLIQKFGRYRMSHSPIILESMLKK